MIARAARDVRDRAATATARAAASAQDAVATARPDILDRNGQILATDVKTPSLFAEPRKLIDVDEAAELLTAVLPDLDATEVRERLSSKRGFVWLKREITPQQQQKGIYQLGIPGVGFLTENKRVYPNGPVVSHVIGHVNIDNQGIAGMEKWLDGQGLAALHMAGLATDRLQQPVKLARRSARAIRAARRAHRGAREVQGDRRRRRDRSTSTPARSSPWCRSRTSIRTIRARRNDPTRHQPADHRRLRDGLDLQGADARDGARLRQGRRSTPRSMRACRCTTASSPSTISTPQHRVLTVPEIFTYSSNIGTARMALALGVEYHKAFLKKLGQLDRLRTELPESAEPLVPKHWGELNTVTIAFGHGLSVAPLQAVMGIAALVNGGMLIPPTFLKRSQEEATEARQARHQARDQRQDALSDAAQRREGHRDARPT